MMSPFRGKWLWVFVLCVHWVEPRMAYPGEWGGRVQEELAFRFGGHPTVTKALSFLQLEGAQWLGPVRGTAIGRVYYDAALDMVDPEVLNPRWIAGDPLDEEFAGAELKEAYLDWITERVDLRLGRQIVRWGLLEGARITDRVNPIDFREFVFRDVEDRYIPLWMLRVDYYPGWGQTQLLIIPDLVFHRPAPAGSEWAEFELPPGTAKPNPSLENTEVGFRAGWRVREAEVTASYLYTWDDFPAAFRSVFGVGSQLTGASFNSRYERLHLFGFTLSRGVGRVVISLEAAYDHGKYLAADPSAGLPGNEIKRDIARWGGGLDMNLAGVDVSWTYFQDRVVGWKPFIPVRRLEQGASFMARETFLNDRLESELLVLYFFTGRQYVARPKAAYRLSDRVKLEVGLDLLGGERGSAPDAVNEARNFRFVGFFKDHDRVNAVVSYRF